METTTTEENTEMNDRVSIRLDTWGDSCTVTITSLDRPERTGEWHFTHEDYAENHIRSFLRFNPGITVAEEVWS